MMFGMFGPYKRPKVGPPPDLPRKLNLGVHKVMVKFDGPYVSEPTDKDKKFIDYKKHDFKPDFKPTNPKDRTATNRLDLSLFPATAEAYGALAMAEGDAKYGGYNYRISGVLASVYRAACKRHLDKWFNGEDEDPKTGVPHLANAIACLAVLVDAIEAGVLKDDRPPKVDVAGLLDRFEAKVKHLHALFPNGPDRFTEVNNGKPEGGMK